MVYVTSCPGARGSGFLLIATDGSFAVGMTFVFCCCALAELLPKLGSDTPGAVARPVTLASIDPSAS